MIALVELVGPCRVAYWDGDTPVGTHHPNAWVQIVAVSQTQTRNTMTLLPSLMSQRLIDTYDIKPHLEIIRANGGRQRLEAVTSNFRALEGGRPTFVALNETHHWIKSNGGHDMYETIDGNATKSKGGTSRYLSITNAYLPGEDSVAERQREAYDKIVEGRAVDVRFLYDSLEANPLTPLTPEALRIVLPVIRGDAVWLDPDTIIESVLNTTISASRSRRMYLNQIVAEEDALFQPGQIKAIEDPTLTLNLGDEIVMGFDGGKTDDDTALVAIRISDRATFVLDHQFRPSGPMGDGWRVDTSAVDSAVHAAFHQYKVKAFYADYALWESHIDAWAETYREVVVQKASETHAVRWDMRDSQKKVTMAHERFMQAILDRKVKHNGNANLVRHALNARRRTNTFGLSFAKESRESPNKVDIYAAWMIAYEALHNYLQRGKRQQQRTGDVWFM